MEAKRLPDSDRDLIIALADDYLNVYSVCLERNVADVIKLDGYVTDGIGENWNDLPYDHLLRTYTNNRVFEDDKEMFYNACCCETLVQVMSTKSLYTGKYRVWEDDGIHYYNYKYVRVSKSDEPLKVVAAFRNIDSLEANEQQKLQELQKLNDILDNAAIGIWQLHYPPGKHPRLIVNRKMKSIMGLPANANLPPEEVFDYLLERVHPNDVRTFQQYDQRLRAGMRTECTYRWRHPKLGYRYYRCGGSIMKNSENEMIGGFHYDINEQMLKEIRSTHIVKAYARSYVFINYCNLVENTFITYTENEIDNDILINMLMSANLRQAVAIALRELVSTEFKDVMGTFYDMDTLNERMKNSDVLVAQYCNIYEVWNEVSFTVVKRNADGTIREFIWAVRGIDDEKQVELRRQKLLEDNIAANKTKTKFLHNMSHEIRTPLNALFGFAQLLGLPDGTWTPEEKEEYNTYIFNSYSMLDMLIRDIMDVADSEHTTSYHVEIGDVTVNTVCRSTLMSVEGRKPFNVNMYFTSDLPDDYIVSSDGRRIQQVLTNYLTNACKNTTEGEIHLHCSKTENPGMLTFSVTDTGIGVPASKADEIFKRFVKLNDHVQGAGLGLNICQMIAAKLGGDVYLDKTYTNGARFVFTIEDK